MSTTLPCDDDHPEKISLPTNPFSQNKFQAINECPKQPTNPCSQNKFHAINECTKTAEQ